MEFVIAVDPQPCPRPRFSRKIGRAYYPKSYADYRRRLEDAFREVWTRAPLSGPCSLKVLCVKAAPKSSKLPFPKPDVDNFAKGVMDAMQGSVKGDRIILEDDWWVQRLEVEKLWAAPGEPGYIHLVITELE